MDSNTLPRVVFMCPAPTKDGIVLMLCDSIPKKLPPDASIPDRIADTSNQEISCVGSLLNTITSTFSSSVAIDSSAPVSVVSSKISNIPLHLGTQSHGKVSYCARIIPSIFNPQQNKKVTEGNFNPDVLTVVGGEDGSVKVFNCPRYGSVSTARKVARTVSNSREESPCNSVFEYLQEVNMPGNVAVKAIAVAPRGSDTKCGCGGIIVAVGGRLTYSIWEYKSGHGDTASGNEGVSTEDGTCVLSFLSSGSINQKSSQDHRILSVTSVLLPIECDSSKQLQSTSSTGNSPADVFLFVMGDSRGRVTVATYSTDLLPQGKSY